MNNEISSSEKEVISEIASHFGISFSNARSSTQSYVSKVYILDDKYVLRSRTMSDATLENFLEETDLLEKIMPKIPFKLPQLLQANDGKPYFVYEELFWTLYPMIPGRIVCTWFDTYKASEVQIKKLLASLRNLHDSTSGLFSLPPKNKMTYVAGLEPKLAPTGYLMSQAARKRLKLAFNRINRTVQEFGEKELCFVHGDYHFGNAVFQHEKPIGLLDLDWSHPGFPLEDLGYTVQTLFRDYRKEFEYPGEMVQLMLQAYGLEQERYSLFQEYLILGAFYDLDVFARLKGIENGDFYLKYQQNVLETLCEKLK